MLPEARSAGCGAVGLHVCQRKQRYERGIGIAICGYSGGEEIEMGVDDSYLASELEAAWRPPGDCHIGHLMRLEVDRQGLLARQGVGSRRKLQAGVGRP